MASARPSGLITYEDLLETGSPPSEVVASLKLCASMDPPDPVILLSPPGCGKTGIVRQVAADIERRLRVTRTYYFNPVDWRGAPFGDIQARLTRYLPPDFLPLDEFAEGAKPMIWFFDDCTVASTNAQAPMYEIMQERTVCERPIGRGVFLVAAGNRAQDRAIYNEMSSALRTRITWLYLRPDVDEWVAWAYSAGVVPEVIGFIKSYGSKHLYNFNPSTDSESFRCPRTWEGVSRLVAAGAPVERSSIRLFAGRVGRGGAEEFVEWTKIFSGLPDIGRILLDGDMGQKAPDESRPDKVYALSAMLVSGIGRVPEPARAKAARNAIAYAHRMYPGREFSVQMYKSMTQTKPYKQYMDSLLLSKEFVAFAKDVKDLLSDGKK